MISKEVLEYLVDFLLGPIYIDGKKYNAKHFPIISYTDKEKEMRTAHVVIKPATFFQMNVYGRAEAEPKLPLSEWEGVPLLYGYPKHEWINNGQTLLIHADIIASTYYLISRYEEMTKRKDRDALGRFPHTSSLLHRMGLLDRPIVDEYALALKKLLRQTGILNKLGISLEQNSSTFSRINLTHSVSKPFKYRGITGIFRGIFQDKQNPISVLQIASSHPKQDPYYTFDKIFSYNKAVSESYQEQTKVQSILFFQKPTQNPFDISTYHLTKPYMYHLISEADKLGAIFGLLCSHKASSKPEVITEEMTSLRLALHQVYLRLYQWKRKKNPSTHMHKQELRCTRDLELMRSRHVSLALREPEDTRELILAGIRHDYSMSYSDALGFRLGTCRPTRAINPNTRTLTELTYHSTTIDANNILHLESQKYTSQEIYQRCIRLIDLVHYYGGELNLHWQSEHFVTSEYPHLGELYERLCEYLINLSNTNRQTPI